MKRKGILTIFVLAILALYAIIYVVPKVTGMLDSTYVAEYGVLSIHDDSTGYLIRNEHVYAAETSGMVNRIAKEGDLLRLRTTPIDISAGTVGTPSERLSQIRDDLRGSMVTDHGNTVQTGGIISFFVDGYEAKLIPENVDSYNYSDLKNITQDQVVALGTNVTSGYPVFKLVDTTKWYLVSFVPKKSMGNYKVGKSIDVIFTRAKTTLSEDSEEEVENTESEEEEINELDTYGSVEMTIRAVEDSGDSAKLVLESSRYFSGLGELRAAECRLISASVRGLMIENESVVELDGKLGVFRKNKKQKYDFIPIKVLGQTDKKTVIADNYYYDEQGTWTKTVDPFDDILKNPEDQLNEYQEEH